MAQGVKVNHYIGVVLGPDQNCPIPLGSVIGVVGIKSLRSADVFRDEVGVELVRGSARKVKSLAISNDSCSAKIPWPSKNCKVGRFFSDAEEMDGTNFFRKPDITPLQIPLGTVCLQLMRRAELGIREEKLL